MPYPNLQLVLVGLIIKDCHPPATFPFLLWAWGPQTPILAQVQSSNPVVSSRLPQPAWARPQPVPCVCGWDLSSVGLRGGPWIWGSGGALGVFSKAITLSIPWPRTGQALCSRSWGLDLAACLWSHPGCAPGPVLYRTQVHGSLRTLRMGSLKGAVGVHVGSCDSQTRGTFSRQTHLSCEFGFILLPSNYNSSVSTRQHVLGGFHSYCI